MSFEILDATGTKVAARLGAVEGSIVNHASVERQQVEVFSALATPELGTRGLGKQLRVLGGEMVVQHGKCLIAARAPALLTLLISESLRVTSDDVFEDDRWSVCSIAV